MNIGFKVAGYRFYGRQHAREALADLERAAFRLHVESEEFTCHAIPGEAALEFFQHLYAPAGVESGKTEREINEAARDQGRCSSAWMLSIDEGAHDQQTPEIRSRRILALAFCATILADALGEEYEPTEEA